MHITSINSKHPCFENDIFLTVLCIISGRYAIDLLLKDYEINIFSESQNIARIGLSW